MVLYLCHTHPDLLL